MPNWGIMLASVKFGGDSKDTAAKPLTTQSGAARRQLLIFQFNACFTFGFGPNYESPETHKQLSSCSQDDGLRKSLKALVMLAGRRPDKTALIAIIFVGVIAGLIFLGGGYHSDWYETGAEKLKAYGSKWISGDNSTAGKQVTPISYDLSKPPTTGCEELVSRLQLRLIEAYSNMLMGIRYVNIWGYLETENKGDAAIWAAQQMLLATLGIQSEQSCRFLDKGCDLERFNHSLTSHEPYSAIIMAGGGNFNDYYWEDQPSRLAMVEAFPNTPVRAFPQSVYMTHEDRISMTQKAFGGHKDLMLAARDLPSWQWLDENLEKPHGVPSVLVPDIAFMWGNRPDFRLNTPKMHDVLILARDDKEISNGNSKDIGSGSGYLDLGGSVGNVSYLKVDWKFTHTPGIDTALPWYLQLGNQVQSAPSPRPTLSKSSNANITEEEILFHKLDFGTMEQRQRGADLMYNEFAATSEDSKNARAWAKATAGFQLLGSAKFVITDRLHGHIMATVIGTPHVLMDSKLGKNLNLHNTWTKECECVRITDNITDALDVARLYFEQNGR